MTNIQEWQRRLAVVDVKLREAEETWNTAKVKLATLQHPDHDIRFMKLSDAIATVAKSFAFLKQRSRALVQFGLPDRFALLSLESLVQQICGTTRSTETANTHLHRALMITYANLGEFHDLQDQREQGRDVAFRFLRIQHAALLVWVNSEHVKLLSVTVEQLMRFNAEMNMMWSPRLEKQEEYQELETEKLGGMVRNRARLKLHGALEHSILSLMSNLSLLGIKLARQTLITEFLDEPLRIVDLQILLISLRELCAQMKERRQLSRGKQRSITDFFKRKERVGFAKNGMRRMVKAIGRGAGRDSMEESQRLLNAYYA